MRGLMRQLRAASFLAICLLPALASGQNFERELYHAEVCNEGQIGVDVAVAYTDFGFINEFFAVHGWQFVRSGECKTIFSHWYAPQNLFSFQSFPLHIAFGFTDSTGVWGAAMVDPPDGIARSRARLCVHRQGFSYEVIADDPQRACTGAGEFLIPASIVWEPTSPAAYPTEFNDEWGPPETFTVALGRDDRAIPMGPQTSSAPPRANDDVRVDVGPSEKGNLLTGNEVTRYGAEWRFADGRRVPDTLIVRATGRPPLAPKEQHSIDEPPIAALRRRIRDVVSSFATCRTQEFPAHAVSVSGFALNEWGVVSARETDVMLVGGEPIEAEILRAAALANLDLARATIRSDGTCVALVIPCRDGAQCGEHFGTAGHSATVNPWTLNLASASDASNVLDALREIAPYYADGRPEIR
jgi:hypothetical protein